METDVEESASPDIVPKFALEMWKMLRAFERSLADLPEEKASKRTAQYRYSKGRLEALLEIAQIRILTFEGQKFTPNLPVSPVNADEMIDLHDLVVESTLEPTIVGDNMILYVGKVLLKGDENVSRD